MKLLFSEAPYLVAGPAHCQRHGLAETVAAAAGGGLAMVQYRAKNMDARSQMSDVTALLSLTVPASIPLVVNDRVDVAVASNADGVHLGQLDIPVADARQMLGREKLIGLTVRSVEEAIQAPVRMLDYLSIGAVFETTSKSDAGKPGGIDTLESILQVIRHRCSLPVVAISGINSKNIAGVLETGVDGVAVVSSICDAQDPGLAARDLGHAIRLGHAGGAKDSVA